MHPFSISVISFGVTSFLDSVQPLFLRVCFHLFLLYSFKLPNKWKLFNFSSSKFCFTFKNDKMYSSDVIKIIPPLHFFFISSCSFFTFPTAALGFISPSILNTGECSSVSLLADHEMICPLKIWALLHNHSLHHFFPVPILHAVWSPDINMVYQPLITFWVSMNQLPSNLFPSTST